MRLMASASAYSNKSFSALRHVLLLQLLLAVAVVLVALDGVFLYGSHEVTKSRCYESENSENQYHSFLYLLLKYQLNASEFTSLPKGVGTSPNPGLATGCRRYTALQIL